MKHDHLIAFRWMMKKENLNLNDVFKKPITFFKNR
jgi:hypothetical protein